MRGPGYGETPARALCSRFPKQAQSPLAENRLTMSSNPSLTFKCCIAHSMNKKSHILQFQHYCPAQMCEESSLLTTNWVQLQIVLCLYYCFNLAFTISNRKCNYARTPAGPPHGSRNLLCDHVLKLDKRFFVKNVLISC